jgi:hypothetical protein
MLAGAYFFVAFPDPAFKEDNVISGTGTKMNMPSIKPRYRTNFFFLLAVILNLPMWVVRGCDMTIYLRYRHADDVCMTL